MPVALTFTGALGAVLDLNDGASFALDDTGNTGIPLVEHDTRKTPARDGSTYVGMYIPERYLIMQIGVFGTSWANNLANRRTLVKALNPKLGVGTLTYTPDATAYAIDCILDRGASFARADHLGPFAELTTLSFLCPNPTWRSSTQNTETVDNSGSGLSVPISVPLSFADGTGTTIINNTGDVASRPVITVPGACTDPIITNTSTGKKLKFVGLTINAGQTLTVDCDARTAKVGTTSVIDKLSSDSEFWALEPGNNTVTFAIASGDVTATVKYYDQYVGV